MFFAASLISLLLLVSPALGQANLTAAHNLTSLEGTWSSGSRQVVTGPGFANPNNRTFIYPPTAGVSYSFTDDGFFESARYRFTGNGSDPHCILGAMVWIHGTYQLLDNGSMILAPFADGYQQIQDPCAAQSNFIEQYNDTELYISWQIFQDPVDGYKLHMFQFDGTPVAPQFQVSTTPNMLPTQLLVNDTPSFVAQSLLATNSGETWTLGGITALASAIFTVALGSFLL